ncbi:sigma 54-interacting transcriptional regulator [Labilithrix luteola]|uniref:sigma 54-interacting transcriptional regulator n=1 Tax=Labilithrix luteola TaxID=1391654 RepID=UPI001F0B55DA|nr:sigma 54-interacting transcriptional regulator [Labilithrix luteola]
MANPKTPLPRPLPPPRSPPLPPMPPQGAPPSVRPSGFAARAPNAPLPPAVPQAAPLPTNVAPASVAPASVPGSMPMPGSVPIPSGHGHVVPEPPGEPRPPAQTVHTVRQLIESVAIPRVTVTVEREGGIAVQRTIVHDGDLCKIGSHASNDVVLRDPMVSRFHCRLVREDGLWRLRDSGSMNGTSLDSVRIRDADLHSEGLLSVGESVVRIRAGAPQKEDFVPMLPSFGALVGTSLPMRRLFALLEKIAQSDINVLIEGESGTGKELVATEIMQRSARADKPFVVVDCGAISPNLVESELFGHIRGAFTGADRDRIGAFEAADGGTVFLDEIGELPIELQPKLLRALEAREIRRVGETKARRVNVRVISATNRDLEREVNKGRFREDLYFRLAVISARVPSLRERLDDLLILTRTFLQQLGVPEEERLFPPAVIGEMAKHDWPGNVRELRNYVERSVVLQSVNLTLRRGMNASSAGPVNGIDLSVPFRLAKDAVIDSFERSYLSQLLEAAGGNMSKAARMAGMDRMYLHRLVQKHGLRGGKGNVGDSIRPSPFGAAHGDGSNQ